MWAAVPNSRFRHAAIAGVVAIGLAIALAVVGRDEDRLPQGVKSPTIALELLRSPSELRDILRTPETVERLRTQTELDFAFLTAYGAFFILLGRVATGSGHRALVAIGSILMMAGVAAMFCDVQENVRMLEILRGNTTVSPRTWSLSKWAAIFVGVAASAVVYVDWNARPLRRWAGYVAALVTARSAIEGLNGIIRGDAKLIEAAAWWMGAGFLLAAVFISTRHVLRDGVLAVFNRLAERPWLRRIAEWPDADDNGVVGDPFPIEPE